jgi:hypothetical protein
MPLHCHLADPAAMRCALASEIGGEIDFWASDACPSISPSIFGAAIRGQHGLAHARSMARPWRATALRALWRKALTANGQHGRGWTPLCWPRRLGPACPTALPSRPPFGRSLRGRPTAFLAARRRALRRLPPGFAGRAAQRHRSLRSLADFAPRGSSPARATGRLRRPSGLGLACGSTALDAHPQSRGASAPAGPFGFAALCLSRSPGGAPPPAKVVGAGAPTARRATLARGPVGRPAAPPALGRPAVGRSTLGGFALDALAPHSRGNARLCLAALRRGSPAHLAALRGFALPCARHRCAVTCCAPTACSPKPIQPRNGFAVARERHGPGRAAPWC